jgi:hypothetical protein
MSSFSHDDGSNTDRAYFDWDDGCGDDDDDSDEDEAIDSFAKNLMHFVGAYPLAYLAAYWYRCLFRTVCIRLHMILSRVIPKLYCRVRYGLHTLNTALVPEQRALFCLCSQLLNLA